MTTHKEILKLALEAFEYDDLPLNRQNVYGWDKARNKAITAIKEALEKPDYEKAYLVWQEKTDWVQETAKPHELGMHRADVLRQRIEALAQPEQERNLKLLPREATPEMLEAMDECSMEGYDERLYAGHAGSVYMAAWDAFAHPPVPAHIPAKPANPSHEQ